jgi:hypothetical protein
MKTESFTALANDLELSIYQSFTEVWEHIDVDTPSNWTRALNSILYNIAKSQSECPLVACKSEPHDNPEWLYDHVWYANTESGSLKNVMLIVESEWKNWRDEDYFQKVQYDFEKLLVGRSNIRFMIFEANTDSDALTVFQQLRDIVISSELSQVGDRYLFACWINSKEFYFDLLTV